MLSKFVLIVVTQEAIHKIYYYHFDNMTWQLMIQEITRSFNSMMRKCMILQDNNKYHISSFSKVASFGFICTHIFYFANDVRILDFDLYQKRVLSFGNALNGTDWFRLTK